MSVMNLSFAGCGFMGIYHVGVAVCIKQYAPQLLVEKISGASAGALAACCLICDMPLGKFTIAFYELYVPLQVKLDDIYSKLKRVITLTIKHQSNNHFFVHI